MTMNIVNIATLKEQLSHYLELVKRGHEVVVTSHRHQVARIVPISSPVSHFREPARPVKDLQKLKGIKSKGSVPAVTTLLADRRRR
jgi:prevent-host-death family protein